MGCLNANQNFNHWFGNIHLSGPCNRRCYFCIGQNMMALDKLNNLKEWPLKNLDSFVNECIARNINEINITGSNTDPLLYRHMKELKDYLKKYIPNLVFGVRTNGALILDRWDVWELFDKASISICSFDPDLYKIMMGKGSPPNIKEILRRSKDKPIKLNVILGPFILGKDLFNTLDKAASLGIEKVNLREPYGQPHVGDPLLVAGFYPFKIVYGMNCYNYKGVQVTYWDVHYVEVESVNLYANGRVSILYPISKGHCPETGKVLGQEYWKETGRIREQWQY